MNPSSNPLYPSRVVKDCSGGYTREDSRQVLIRFTSVMRKHKVRFFAMEGTLLGAIRNNTWYLPIDAESYTSMDFDFGIRAVDFEAVNSDSVRDDLSKAGFAPARQKHPSDYYLESPSDLCGLAVELWQWHPCGNDSYAYFDHTPYKSRVQAKHEAWMFDGHLSELILDSVSICVPNEPHIVLRRTYGKDYMRPSTAKNGAERIEGVLTGWAEGLYDWEESRCD